MQKKITPEAIKQLQALEKEFGVTWFVPTQKDAITALGNRIRKLFFAQRRFRPSDQKSLMDYHRAVKIAEAALDAMKEKAHGRS